MSCQRKESEIKTQFNCLFENFDYLKDAVFTFPDHPGRTVRAHKMILASASPVFNAMFYGGLKEQGSVEIQCIHPDTFQKLIDYTYGQEVAFEDTEDAIDFYIAADRFDILAEHMMDYLKTRITIEDCVTVFEIAYQFGADEVVKMCRKVFEHSTSIILRSKNFLKASAATVNTIFSLRRIGGLNELRMCKYLDSWLVAQDGNFNENLQSIKQAIHSIRFLSVKKLKRRHLKKLRFLTDAQKEMILKKKTAVGQNVQYPPGFSMSEEDRRVEALIPCEKCNSFFLVSEPYCDCDGWPTVNKFRARHALKGIREKVEWSKKDEAAFRKLKARFSLN